MKYLPEILSVISSMGGSYMLWVKPLQDRMDMMSRQIMELQDELREVLRQNKNLQRELESQSGQKLSGSNDFLPTKRNSSFPSMRRI
jgi:predicted  nucleic acid-binding Zn-ribbon protein